MARENEIIHHLTKEIETQSNNMMLFRSRINLTIYIGPFVILGSYVIANDGKVEDLSLSVGAWLSIIVLAACFILLGVFCGRIERHSWSQCNKWRELIAELQSENPPELKKDPRFIFPEWLVPSYLLVYLFMFVAFVCTFLLLFKL